MHPKSKFSRIPRLILGIAIIASAWALAGAARADDYPNRPITIIVPFPPGGLADLTIALLSRELNADLKQPIVISYRPGARGATGATLAKDAPPDGYTLLIADAAIMAINPTVKANLPYDPTKDFTPIDKLVLSSHVLVVSPKSPVKTFAELRHLARHEKRPLTFASAGAGGGRRLLGEMLKQRISGDVVPTRRDLREKHVKFYFESVALALPHIVSHGMRPLAVTSRQRLAAYPGVPTLTELGYPDVNADSWFGLFAPAGLPQPIVDRLHNAFAAALQNPAVVRALGDQGLDAAQSSPADLAKTVRTDIERYDTLIKWTGAKVD